MVNKAGNINFWRAQIKRLPLQTPVVASPDTPVNQAIIEMQNRRTGCVLVQDSKGDLVGIFTERDVMNHVVGTSLNVDTPLSEIMTKNPEYIGPEFSVAKVIDFFGEKKFRHLPVLDKEKKILGLLSVRVVVDFIAENLPGEVLNLPPDEGIISSERAGG